MSLFLQNVREFVWALIEKKWPEAEGAQLLDFNQAKRRFAVLKPLAAAVDGEGGDSEGSPNPQVLAAWLAEALRLDVEDVKVTMTCSGAPPALPKAIGHYQALFHELLFETREMVLAGVERDFGAAAHEWMQKEFELCFEDLLYPYLRDEYGAFIEEVGAKVAAHAIKGWVDAVLLFLLALVVNDEEAVRLLAPLMRQWPYCMPVGALTKDSQHWYVVRPDFCLNEDDD